MPKLSRENLRRLLKKKGIDYEPPSTYWESFARLFYSSAREYLKEQKPAEWSEEDEEALNMCLDAIPKKWKTKSGILLTKWLKDNIYLQSKPKWSDGEYGRLFDIEHYLDGTLQLSPDRKIACIDFIKSLRLQPQRKDTYYDIIHNILASLRDVDFMQITPEHRVSLLNDIRVKCKNADECAAILDGPHWKPSKYILSLVKKVADGEMLTGVEQMNMGTLHEKLKLL